ncbi:MAG: hypothetical protein QOC86_2804, partial [Gaiellales bacterium]|nr:hypothetical protein [Gaiellales bacterium]
PLICVDEPRHDRWGEALPPFTGAITSFIANNNWWTNYPQEQGGTICSRYRLSTLPASASRADRFRAGWEAAVPLVAYPVRAAEAYGLLADGDAFLTVDGACAMVVGLQADGTCRSGGPTLRVRVQEIAGTGGTCTIGIPPEIGSVSAAARANADGGHGAPLAIVDGAAVVPLRAGEVVQVVLDAALGRR